MQDRTEGGGGVGGGPGTEFEAGLRRHAFRAPPPEWRADILTGAAAGAISGESRGGRAREGAGGEWIPWWSGWGTVAAAWLLILGLNRFATVDVVPGRMGRAPFSPQALALIAERQRAALGSWAGSGAEAGEGGDRAPAAEGGAPGGVPRADRTRERGMGDRKRNFVLG